MASSCKVIEKVEPPITPNFFIMGSGGGVSGTYTTYKIHNNGRIEQWDALVESYDYFKQIPLDSASACLKALDALDILHYSFDAPGNMTYFIEVHEGEDINLIKWGEPENPISKDIEEFFLRTKRMVESDYKDRWSFT